MSAWLREKIMTVFGSDERVVRKIDALDDRQRELGHDIRNIQMKLDPLRKLVERLTEDDHGARRPKNGT